MNYVSLVWASNFTETHHNILQTIQNKALKIITGYTATTPTDHLHHETKVLKFKEHIDMRSTQALSVTTRNPLH